MFFFAYKSEFLSLTSNNSHFARVNEDYERFYVGNLSVSGRELVSCLSCNCDLPFHHPYFCAPYGAFFLESASNEIETCVCSVGR